MAPSDFLSAQNNTETDNPYSGPQWDNTTEYPSIHSSELQADLQRIEELLAALMLESKKISPFLEKTLHLSPQDSFSAVKAAQKCYLLYTDALTLIANVLTFANCELSTNSRNNEAAAVLNQGQKFWSDAVQALQPALLFLRRAPNDVVEKYLDHPEVSAHRFIIEHGRKTQHELLSLSEENLISALETNGHKAWGNLYTRLSGRLQCKINEAGEEKVMGVAAAQALMQSADSEIRKQAWTAINHAWSTQEESCASILNALAGWRLEICKKRSHTRPVHFLDSALHANHIQKETLIAMMGAVSNCSEVGRRVFRAKAKAMGKERLDSWDLSAPPPSLAGSESQKLPFLDAMKIIEDAFKTVDPTMAQFTNMMLEKRWIEAGAAGSRNPGAYCTSFVKSRSPRVYMTYSGNMSDVGTLAHELGHAFHNWVIRDLPLSEVLYPSTLAETASIFAETVVSEALVKYAKRKEDLFSVAWNQMKGITSYLLATPACFEFEKKFYERREDRPLTPDELTCLMKKALEEKYKGTVTEANGLAWQQTLHFYMTHTSFYNFPYTFGYLFSLGIYFQKEKMGSRFYGAYLDLLKDTGRMTAEDLVRKHLDADITQPRFWEESIAIVERQVASFESLVAELFPA